MSGSTRGMAALATLAIGSAALAQAQAPTQGEPLAGRTMELAKGVQVTVVQVQAPDLSKSAMSRPRITVGSDLGEALSAVVHDMGEQMAAAGALPPAAEAGTFSLKIDESAGLNAGSSVTAGIEAGFPKGINGPSLQPGRYAVDYRLTLVRKSDGASRTLGCHGSGAGQVSRFSGQDVGLWAPLVSDARAACVRELIVKARSLKAFFAS